jgi:hypothetical protein
VNFFGGDQSKSKVANDHDPTPCFELIPKNHHICAENTQNHHYLAKLQKTTGFARIRSNVHLFPFLPGLTPFLTDGPTISTDVASRSSEISTLGLFVKNLWDTLVSN